MIALGNGEVGFKDGLTITAQCLLSEVLATMPAANITMRPLQVPGWQQHMLGEHPSETGVFRVEVITDEMYRVEAVCLSHQHPFYKISECEDIERRAFHEGLIASELLGQKEFPWGHVFCRYDLRSKRDFLVIIYSPYTEVPRHQRQIYRVLQAHEIPAHDRERR